MNQENVETETVLWAEEHPWLAMMDSEEEDSMEEQIRFALDELRIA